MSTSQRVAVVTGAGRGIGRAIAQRLVGDGFRVVVADIDPELAAASAVALGDAAEALVLDVADRDAVAVALSDVNARFGRIDAVVNNAMWIRYGPAQTVDEETLDRMLAVGLKALFWTTQAVVPIMTAQGSGAIVNVSSPAAVRGVTGSAAYSAVKGGVSSLTWQLAGELGPLGIRVNAVVPGAVPTEGARALVDEEGYRRRLSATPLGRLGAPEDLADAVAFLVSERAAFVNGHLLVVDGGLLAS
ncbi:MAG TPA: SDR family oxidoreductase [Pseudolysinimonas sp.]|nr:SDR family oxidoreductase [Pseudolysinimonas sp.]